jgi:hypothetical protein
MQVTPSTFLIELADKLDSGPLCDSDRKPLALLCRDYACLSLHNEQPVPPQIVAQWRVARQRKPKAAPADNIQDQTES